MSTLIILGLLVFVIKKLLFPSKDGRFGISLKEGINNYLNPGNFKPQAQIIDKKPHPQDPSKSQSANNSKEAQEEELVGNTRIKSYGDFNPDYMNSRMELTDEKINIDLSGKPIKDININGKSISTLRENKEEIEKLSKDNISNRILSEGNLVEQNGVLVAKTNSMIKQSQSNIKSFENGGQIREYSSNIKELKEIKGPVKAILVDKFFPPKGFKVQNLVNGIPEIQQLPNMNSMQNMQGVSGVQNMQKISSAQNMQDMQRISREQNRQRISSEQNMQNMQKISGIKNMQYFQGLPEVHEEQIQLMEGNEKKFNNKKIVQPKSMPHLRFEKSPKAENSLIVGNSKLETRIDGMHDRPVNFTGKRTQHEKIETLIKEYNDPENKNLSHKEIVKMNQIITQLLNEDKERILSQQGHLPYLNRTEVNELNRNKQMYSNIYKMAQQSDVRSITDKKTLREVANKVSMLGKQRQEEASKQASKEVENRMPDINRKAFHTAITGDDTLSDKFVDYMSQFIDLDNVELNENEMKKYREQAEKNMIARNELSPEAIEEEYNRLYKNAKKEKMLEKIFSSSLDEIKEITYDIINIPEIGIALFGEEEYYNLVKRVDKISDSEYRQLYNEIKENIMSELYGREKNTQKDEKKKTNRNLHRTSYQDYVQRRKQMQDINSDIKTVLGINDENETDENSGVMIPIKTYTPNVINDEENKKVI